MAQSTKSEAGLFKMNRPIALLLVLMISPFMVLVMFLCFLIDGRPVFFNQIRVGKGRQPFIVHKLRTMKNGHITWYGRILRKTGIDEVPQLWNIIKGEMSFIGPRPLTESDVNRLAWNSDYYNVRWDVTPGITGLAQLAVLCHKKVTWFCDRYYVLNKSVKLDCWILIQTLKIVLMGKGDRR